MRKVINNRMYDTESANEIAINDCWDNTNCGYIETLYRKRNKEFFLFGEGGCMSPYAVRREDDHWWTYGKHIKPLTDDEARIWAEEHMDADAYATHFAPVAE